MSDTVLITLATIFASLISVGITSLVSYLIAKNKSKAEIGNINVDSSLKGGEVATHFIDLSERLSKKYETSEQEKENLKKQVEQEKMELKKQVEQLQRDVDELKRLREEDRKELMKIIEDEKDYSSRLELQLSSWRIAPVPRDIDSAKLAMKENLCIDGDDMVSESK
jgi:hypothetical protein